MSLCYVLFLFDCLLVVLSLSIGEWVHDPCYLQRPFAADRSAPLKVKSKNRCSPQERPSQKLKTKIETQPKPSSKRIENASLASYFGRLWGGVHDPVHLNRPFTLEHCQTDAIMIRSVLNNALTIIARDLWDG